MAIVAGVDGCPGGWLCLWGDPERGALSAGILERLEDLLGLEPRPVAVGVDVPIGLPERGVRACDREARRLLGRPRASSVFPAPLRPMLAADSYREACRIGEGKDGRRLSRQAWNILPKVREMDAFLAADPSRAEWVHEVHPETSFAVWNGGVPMAHNKKTAAGAAERNLLAEGWLGTAWPYARSGLPASGYARDDLLDAVAALWSARRIAVGEALRRPPEPERDARGLAMEIRA
ncbi:hypothetical protein AN478_00370 [Thiohalorhabdus denitrificans]|uniref:Predicted nuclease (RNAse H fold) n=1 Tax=Thiohalorhabdus denitrificans TaxID=381306 RepID=A0A0P9EH47_9GAMM|nr:DUF429 domain-containing protein [Thiohalorhabdus denitrificans]KPV41888.1 hypothetical protein AN478_00370 [Thiohalorhabdus denitrificans]SCY65498.1 Predicted nuclease (RNAse H fold) [Thiohalorhabdus denitrificans]